MSIPKEPRQLMINIMYIVLTAMLALNVSAEIFNAFKVVNAGLVKSNDALDKSNDQLPKQIDEFSKRKLNLLSMHNEQDLLKQLLMNILLISTVLLKRWWMLQVDMFRMNIH
ncbi:MAG: hypothetical protein IPN87_08495 [Saprospiraceae bacterium]|nr:hypothetical protein [Candidatus Brachybacter algidus]